MWAKQAWRSFLAPRRILPAVRSLTLPSGQKELNKSILRSCTKGNLPQAKEALLRMTTKGYLPSSGAVDRLLRLCETSDDAQAASQIMAFLEEKGIKQDLELRLHLREENLTGAREAFSRMMERGLLPTRETITRLLHLCETSGSAETIDQVATFMEEKGVALDESVGNMLARALLAGGETKRAKSVFSYMQAQEFKVRTGSLSRFLESAAASADLDFVWILLRELEKQEWAPDTRAGREVLRMAVELESEEEASRLVEGVLQVYQRGQSYVDMEIAEEVAAWAERCSRASLRVQDPVLLQQAHINQRGVCSACGDQLQDSELTTHQHQQLLELSGKLLEEGSNSFLDNSRELAEVEGFKRLIARKGPFTAVIDGLNMSYLGGHQQRDGRQVVQIAGLVQKKLQGNVLIIARNHLARKIPTAETVGAHPSDVSRHYEPTGLHFFFLGNRVSDDLFFVHGCMASGPHTFLVSNDMLTDYADALPKPQAGLFARWQRSRHIMAKLIRKKYPRLLFPHNYDPVVQWTDRGWHLPVTDEQWICIRSQ